MYKCKKNTDLFPEMGGNNNVLDKCIFFRYTVYQIRF